MIQAWTVLVTLGFLTDGYGQPCPECGKPLSKLVFNDETRHPYNRCNRKGCKTLKVRPTEGTWADHELPLRKLAGLAYLASGMMSAILSADDAGLACSVGHAVAGQVLSALRSIITLQHNREQATIVLSGQCEADATTLRTVRLSNGRIKHIRYFGMSRRGDRSSTIVYPLPTYTTPPGGKTRPESIDETEHLMARHTGNEVLIWHTDGARCYRRLPLNTRVKHYKKMWTAVKRLVLDDGDVLVCYGGTELQDGLWTHMKKAVPLTMTTSTDGAEGNLEAWVAFWAWKHRRAHVPDMFSELGAAVQAAREADEVW